MKRPMDRTMRMAGAVLLMSLGIPIGIVIVYAGLSLAGTWGGIIGALVAFFVVVAFFYKWIFPVIYEEYEE